MTLRQRVCGNAIRIGGLFAAGVLLSLSVAAAPPASEQSPFEGWKAGTQVTPEAVAQFGPERCFTAREIDERAFARMQGRSYKDECTVPRSELRYITLLHYDLEGRICLGELVCNKAIAGELTSIFRTLYDARYPIERMVLIDDYQADDRASMLANNSSAFNFRFVAGTQVLSAHSRGLAVDINPLYNPYVKVRDGRTIVDPPEAAPYVDRTGDFPCKIDSTDLCCKEFIRHGFTWGGDWHSLKDYQHFEKKLP